MLADIIHAHGLKRTRAYMQGNVGDLYARRLQTIQHGLVEMQAGRGRSNGARRSGINGLVTLIVFGIGRMGNIGWQGQGAILIKQI